MANNNFPRVSPELLEILKNAPKYSMDELERICEPDDNEDEKEKE